MQGQKYTVRIYDDPNYGFYSDFNECWIENNGKGFCFNYKIDDECNMNVFYSEKPRNVNVSPYRNEEDFVSELEPVTIPIELYNACIEYLKSKEKLRLHSFNFLSKQE